MREEYRKADEVCLICQRYKFKSKSQRNIKSFICCF